MFYICVTAHGPPGRTGSGVSLRNVERCTVFSTLASELLFFFFFFFVTPEDEETVGGEGSASAMV